MTMTENTKGTEREHKGLLSRLDSIEALIENRDPEARSRWQGAIAAFQKEMLAHFTGEEGARGLFEDIRTHCPHRLDECTRLKDEHTDLRERADDLLNRLAGGLELDRLAQDIRDFSAAIRQHEGAEQQLLWEAYSRDEGAVD